MALQKAGMHANISLPEGYWALRTISVDAPAGSAYVTIGLYADAAAYAADPVGNMLRGYEHGFQIGGADYQTIFDPTHSVQQIVGDVFVFIKTWRPSPDEPAPFADAEIVP